MRYCFIFGLINSCQPIDPGERTVVRPQFYPDPAKFETTIRPLLQARCGSTECHGRPTTFRLHEASDQLPESFWSDYFNVLYFVDLNQPADSELWLFGTGTGRGSAHPGGKALSDEDAATILNWLEADGATP